MIESNNLIKLDYTRHFPDIYDSDKKLYVYCETITSHNWKDIFNKNIDIFKRYDNIILDNRYEAPYFDEVNNLIDLLKKNNITNVLFVDGGLSTNFKIKTAYYPTFIEQNNKNFIRLKDKNILFISLARVICSRFYRLSFTYELYRNNLLSDGIVTCGSSEEKWGYDGLDLFPEDFQKIIPLCYDGIVDRQVSSYSHLTFGAECLINIVQESAFDSSRSEKYPSMYFIDWSVWNRPFFTEKTTKAFNAGQIPLFVALPGYVNILKIMGFDVFDDIVDHSYDNELSPDKRIIMVSEELLRLKKIGLENLKKVNNLEERLLYNKRHLKIVYDQMFIRYKQTITSWFFD